MRKIELKSFRIIIIALLVLVTIKCSNNNKSVENRNGDYLGEKLPSDTVQIFAEGLVSTQFEERDMAISPNGDEIFYSLKGPSFYSLIYVKRVNGEWTEKTVASFSGKHSDLEPCFSPDGSKLFFVSNRPNKTGGDVKDYDIWYVEKTKSGWGNPVNPGEPLNSEANEFYPSITKNETIYFCARTENAIGGEDLFYSKLDGGKYQQPVNLGDSINTARDEFNAFVSPDENYIIYTSTGFGDGFGGGDLWISFKNENNEWRKPKNMGKKINSDFLDYCPSVTPDDKYLFFTSNRREDKKIIENPLQFDQIINGLQSTLNGSQNIYWIDARIIDSLK